MSVSVRRCAIGAATSAAMILASAAPALAATHHPAPAKHRGATQHHTPARHKVPAKHKPATVARFTAHGVVLAVTGNKVKVLSNVAKVGKKAEHNQVVTLTLTPRTHKVTKAHTRPGTASALLTHDTGAPTSPASTAPVVAVVAVGDDINAEGTVGSDGSLVTTTETSTVLPAEALIGQITTVNQDGSFVVATHDQVDGDHAEHDSNPGTLVAAAGATLTGPTAAAGDYVVVLGEAQDRVMTAAKVYTFTAAPTLAAGAVSAADATAKSLTLDAEGSESDGQEQGDSVDGSNPSVMVDASTAEVVINGATPTASAFPAVGDEVLSVGTAGTTADTMTASLVFDFNSADTGSVQDNQDNEDTGSNGSN